MSLRKFRTYNGSPYVAGGEPQEEPQADPQPELQADISAEKLDAYMNMDDDARWKLLIGKVASAKRAGTMTNDDLDAFAQSCHAVLDASQYERLLKLIASIKG